METLSRKSLAYSWDCVWLLELEILHYYESAESQAKYISGTVSSV
jgi:hypothetical protein